ncbi:glycosyl transferase family 14 [Empedobacter falsenii]|uniref:beta-1,6-N-acetylglucosaminyltransferase n=1 Tax=Empedobacter falsenii TaxID=343874 RepID=UPI002575AFA2|nr:beta-1,6-N-acetylglucosaminyltransferase [Empedobacter falsenii]MDM1547823.1 glycosyl transferase family 14 [Empedobacter falsenii]
MTNIYLIQAHQYPGQLKRLIKRINSENVLFYIHIDLKTDIEPFKDVISGKNIVFIKDRVDCIWGDFSQVQATLNLCEEVLNQGFDLDTRITLLSGQDYPIKSKDYIREFFNNNKGIDFINIEKIDKSRIHHLRNLKAFKINHSSKRSDFTLISKYHYKNILKSLFYKKISFKDLKLLFKNKCVPLGMKPYRGSSWWSFNYTTLEAVLNFYQKNKDVLNVFYSQTFCPDENFFQTILMHLKNEDNSIEINASITYDNWIRKGVDLPVTFQLSDFDELDNQPNNKLFARKFDSNFDSLIMNELDKKLGYE